MRKLLLLFGIFFVGMGVGAILRVPPDTYRPVRVVYVGVDATPSSCSYPCTRLVDEENKEGTVGCRTVANECLCDSPWGVVSIPLFVECDIARGRLWEAATDHP
ncbi:hypothetical protein [Thermogutta sp.]|uniref:hypothetical protein n=1 Tax=Thermogutta sp. TaxID=1962930 RepID=UPI00322075E4